MIIVVFGDIRKGNGAGDRRLVRQGVEHLGGLAAGHFLVGKEPSVIGGHVVLCHTVVGGTAVPGVGFDVFEVRALVHRIRRCREVRGGSLRGIRLRRLFMGLLTEHGGEHDGHLRTGDHALRLDGELSVFPDAGDDAPGHRPLHGRSGVAADGIPVGEELQTVPLRGGIFQDLGGVFIQHRYHLLPGDGGIRKEVSGRVAGHDAAGSAPGDGIVMPLSREHVIEAGGGIHRGRAGHGIEDLRCLGAGHLALRLELRGADAGHDALVHDVVDIGSIPGVIGNILEGVPGHADLQHHILLGHGEHPGTVFPGHHGLRQILRCGGDAGHLIGLLHGGVQDHRCACRGMGRFGLAVAAQRVV